MSAQDDHTPPQNDLRIRHQPVILELLSMLAFRGAHMVISKLTDTLSAHVSPSVFASLVLIFIVALTDKEYGTTQFVCRMLSSYVRGLQESAEDDVHEILVSPHHHHHRPAAGQASMHTMYMFRISTWPRTTQSERRARSSQRRRMVRVMGVGRESIRMKVNRRGLRVLMVVNANTAGGRRGRRCTCGAMFAGGEGGGDVPTSGSESRMQTICPPVKDAQK